MKNNNTEKRKFYFFKRLLLSITDISAYSTFIRELLSTAIKYFLILILLVNIIPFILFYRNLRIEMGQFKNWLANHLPKMWLKDGVLHCEGEQPLQLVYGNYINLILDTTDQTKRIDPELDDCILLNSKKITVKFRQSEQQSFYFPEDLSMEINQETLDRFEKRSLLMIIPISGIVMYIFQLIKKSMEIIFFSILLSTVYSVYCMAKKTPNPGRLKEFFAAGIYGITAPLCLEILIGISGFHLNYILILVLYYGLYMLYLIQVFRRIIIKQPAVTDNVDGLNT